MSRSVVVVGTSIAGVRAAQALRRNKFEGPITLVGAEDELPYDKPPLSKAVLAGSTPAETARLLSAGDAAALDLTLRLGVAATGLDVAAGMLELADGSTLGYDDLIVATGARARPSPWQPDSGVHVLRSLADCRALRADLARGGAVVVVGGGFIGAEVASTCRALGRPVTLVDPVPVPMARLVGSDVGQRMVELHHLHGSATRFGAGVEDITGGSGELIVHLTDGTALRCATVIVGIGSEPNDGWLSSSGLLVDDGVVCDEFGRTSAPSIYALGDVARWLHPRHHRHIRAEHWTNAVDQAACVANTITAPDALRAHDPVEFVWSDQYDWRMQVVGAPGTASRDVTIEAGGDTERFATLYADDDEKLCGGAIVNWPKASITLRRALASRDPFTSALERVEALLPV